MMNPQVGDPLVFQPSAFAQHQTPGAKEKLNGKVIYVNREHRYYTVEAKCYGYTIRESFKF